MRELERSRGGQYASDIFQALSAHPTLERVRTVDGEYRRSPGEATWTPHVEEA